LMGHDNAVLRGSHGLVLRDLLCDEPCRVVDSAGEARYTVICSRSRVSRADVECVFVERHGKWQQTHAGVCRVCLA
jgi:hypothetical protein